MNRASMFNAEATKALIEDLARARQEAVVRMFLNLATDGMSPGTLDRGKRGLALIAELHAALVEYVEEGTSE
jgi:hypothetical protein